MEILFDFHSHTTYSHGKGSVREMADAAIKQGLIAAITDHGAEHRFFGVNDKKMRQMRKDIDEVNRLAGKTVLLQGVEANVTGHGKTDVERSGGSPQVILVGYHKGAGMVWGAGMYMQAMLDKKAAEDGMTDALIAAISSDERICAISHPGLYVPVDISRLALACSKEGVALELSARHPMSAEDARMAFECGASFIISSDAHTVDKLGYFKPAIELAAQAGIPAAKIVNAKGYVKTGNMRLEKYI